MLARRLAVDAEDLNLFRRPLLPQREYHAEKAQRQGVTPARRRSPEPWISSLRGKIGFYEQCLRRCYNEVSEGNRYWSMCALTVVARKVEYPKEDLEQDLENLRQHYNDMGKQMKSAEVKKALKMYNQKALQTRSTTLERWFGWDFRRNAQQRRAERAAKGKVRTKEEHLRVMSAVRDALYPDGAWRNAAGAPTKQQIVEGWREKHPDGTPRECIEATGISKNTVYKWWSGEEKVYDHCADPAPRRREARLLKPAEQKAVDTAQALAEAIMALNPEERQKLLDEMTRKM